MGYSYLVLKMRVIDPDLQDHFGHFDAEFVEIWFVCMIACHKFDMESPNLHQTCIVGHSRLALKMGVIDFDLQINFVHFHSEF